MPQLPLAQTDRVQRGAQSTQAPLVAKRALIALSPARLWRSVLPPQSHGLLRQHWFLPVSDLPGKLLEQKAVLGTRSLESSTCRVQQLPICAVGLQLLALWFLQQEVIQKLLGPNEWSVGSRMGIELVQRVQ